MAELAEKVELAISSGTEKARSELIVTDVLFELRKYFNRRISFFSGIEFSVDAEQGLTGMCDFLVSLSPILSFLEAPGIILVEAKRENLTTGFGQCAAEMLAAQRFNKEERECHRPHLWGYHFRDRMAISQIGRGKTSY